MSTIADSQVCAVIITYNPSEGLKESLIEIRPQVSHLVIIDNGSARDVETTLEELRSKFECDLILNRSNLGIAKALNLGIEYAQSRGCQYVVFFDQDSIVGDSEYVASLLEAYDRSIQSRRVAIVAPRYVDRSSGAELSSAMDRDDCLLTAMTSGTLIPAQVFERIGIFEESFYMDYVDIEFSLRCRREGYSIVEATKALLLHSLGRRTTHNFCGRPFSTTNHNASRRYYITRNRLLTMHRYWRDWQWFIREVRAFVAEFLKIILVEENRNGKLKGIALGVVDALRNKTGRQVAL